MFAVDNEYATNPNGSLVIGHTDPSPAYEFLPNLVPPELFIPSDKVRLIEPIGKGG